jgi:peptidoglycan/LPS O-acetylase OafA/YrhL
MLQVGLKRLRDFFRVSNDRTAAMDGARGLAVLIVFLSHSSGRQQALTSFLQFQGIGHIGVYLFFVLSGYLLADHLFHEYALKGNISIQKFLIRRCCRILPLYYFVLTATIIYQQSTGKIHRNYLILTKAGLDISNIFFFTREMACSGLSQLSLFFTFYSLLLYCWWSVMK